MGILAVGFLVAETGFSGVTRGGIGFSGAVNKCASTPASMTNMIKPAMPAKAFSRELLNDLFLRVFLRLLVLRVVFRFAI